MSDSIDRVFIKAISTVKTMSSSKTLSGSLSRPSPETRIKLYGLYKQATEGNVVDIVCEPPHGNSVQDQGNLAKWKSWKNFNGMTKTEAKRQYITLLIETMHLYATKTSHARELVNELEFMWDQVKNVDASSDSSNNSGIHEQQSSAAAVMAKRVYNYTPSILSSSSSPPPPRPKLLHNDNDDDSRYMWKHDIMIILQNMQAELEILQKQQQIPSSSSSNNNNKDNNNNNSIIIRLVIRIIKTLWNLFKYTVKDAALFAIIFILIKYSHNNNNNLHHHHIKLIKSWIYTRIKKIPLRIYLKSNP